MKPVSDTDFFFQNAIWYLFFVVSIPEKLLKAQEMGKIILTFVWLKPKIMCLWVWKYRQKNWLFKAITPKASVWKNSKCLKSFSLVPSQHQYRLHSPDSYYLELRNKSKWEKLLGGKKSNLVHGQTIKAIDLIFVKNMYIQCRNTPLKEKNPIFFLFGQKIKKTARVSETIGPKSALLGL